MAINIERNVISLKRQFDVKYGPTVNSYVDQIVRQYDSNVRPTIDPYLGQVVNVSTPYVISLKENSVLAYRYAEKYCVIYTRQAGVFLEKNVFTGNCFSSREPNRSLRVRLSTSTNRPLLSSQALWKSAT